MHLNKQHATCIDKGPCTQAPLQEGAPGSQGYKQAMQASEDREGQQEMCEPLGQACYCMGSGAQAAYSGNVFGTTPTERQALRRRIGQAISPGHHGRCQTTHLALELDEGEPGITTLVQVLNSWITVITTGPRERALATVAWTQISKHSGTVAERDRWRQGTGIAFAMNASLRDLGRQPLGPWAWRDEDDELYDNDEQLL